MLAAEGSRDTTTTSPEGEAIVRTIHLRAAQVLAVWILAVTLPAVSATAKPSPPSLQELETRVEEYMAARVKRDHFSGSILIAREGNILFSKGYGMANHELDVPNTPQTKYRLGSITKQFTAMAILILQRQGKLSIHDKIKKYMVDAPKAWDEITIEHLLTHTSGIYNYTESLEFLKTLPVRVTLKELIAKFKDRPLNFKPGEKFSYSNSGYVVLGQIIETASGQNYPSFMKQAIFDPLGMNETGYDNATSILKHRASGYVRRLGIVLTNCDYVDMSIPHAAGALYSTTLDLLKWDQALYTEKLVPRSSLDAMFTSHKGNYGYGWLIDKQFGQTRYEHGGGIMGFVTIIERFPDDKLLVVALSNLENSPIGAIGTRPGRDRAGAALCRASRAQGSQAGPGNLRRLHWPLPGRSSRQGAKNIHGPARWLTPLVRAHGKSQVRAHPRIRDAVLHQGRRLRGTVRQGRHGQGHASGSDRGRPRSNGQAAAGRSSSVISTRQRKTRAG